MIYHTQSRVARRNGKGTGSTFADLEQAARFVTSTLRPHLDEFDAIVVTGVSGMAVGFPVALRLKKTILVLRKPNEDSHGGRGELIGSKDARRKGHTRVLFLDDFVTSGESRWRAFHAVRSTGMHVVGECLYGAYIEEQPNLSWAPDFSKGWNPDYAIPEPPL